jgi:hypothetical protein
MCRCYAYIFNEIFFDGRNRLFKNKLIKIPLTSFVDRKLWFRKISIVKSRTVKLSYFRIPLSN